MIKSVTVTNYLGESIKLELGRPEQSGFSILSIDGLGPSKANINTSELATSDGSFFNSARLTSRNIVMNLKYMWKPTVDDARLLSYKYFPVKKQVKLVFDTDQRICEIEGYVESNTPTIFSRDSGTQISIICPDPYFYSVEDNVTLFYGVVSKFEFPFENDSLDEDLIEFGEIANLSENNIYYDGDAEVGIQIMLHALGDVVDPTIHNLQTLEVMGIDTARLETISGFGIIAGDTITINTVKGKKSISLLRDGEYFNILNCLNRNADWFHLVRGDNLFAFTADEGIINLQFRIRNRVAFEGV